LKRECVADPVTIADYARLVLLESQWPELFAEAEMDAFREGVTQAADDEVGDYWESEDPLDVAAIRRLADDLEVCSERFDLDYDGAASFLNDVADQLEFGDEDEQVATTEAENEASRVLADRTPTATNEELAIDELFQSLQE